jgi:branched-chain amino acid transport system substrate-binding protein
MHTQIGKKLLRGLAGLLALAAASGGTALAAPEVKIGSILPLSGASAPQGAQARRAQELAVEEINAAGGIKALGGAQIKLIFADSQTKPQVAVAEAERLLTQEGVAFLMGAYNSGVTLPASEVAERYKKVWFAPVSSDISITRRGFKYIFRMAENSEMRVQAQINYIAELQKKFGTKLTRFALVYENNTYGQGNAEAQRRLVKEMGWQVVLDEAFDPKAADVSPVIAKVKAANPDVVILANSYMPSTIQMAKGFKEQKVKPKAFVATSASHTDPDYIANVGDIALGVFDVSGWEPDVNRPYAHETAQKFQARFGIPMNNETAKEYVGLYVVKDVLERAKSLDSEAIRQAFVDSKITTGIPQMYNKVVHFDKTGTFPDLSSMVMVQFQKVNGKIERVTILPEDSARKGFKPVFPYSY